MKARENPFRSDRVLRVRYRPEEGTWDGLMARLADLGYRAEIAGPQGAGKTTLIEDLAPRLRALGFGVRFLGLDGCGRKIPRAGVEGLLNGVCGRDVILLDGADLLSMSAWRLLKRRARRAAGLVVTTHRRGMLPGLVRCMTSAALLDYIVGRLAGGDAARLGGTTRALYRKHRGNLRNCLRELYDLYAARTA